MLANQGVASDGRAALRALGNGATGTSLQLQGIIDVDAPEAPPLLRALQQLDKSLQRALDNVLWGRQMAMAFCQNMQEESNVFSSAREAIQRLIDEIEWVLGRIVLMMDVYMIL